MKAILLAAVAAIATGGAARAHDAHAGHTMEATTRVEPAEHIHLGDASLVDQTGAPVLLASGALAGKIVIVDFIYTTCTTVCPVASATIAAARHHLGARMNGEVAHVSITTDPVTDTPERLAGYMEPFEPLAGWRLLTGEKATVDAALTSFGAYTPDFRDHPQMVLVGDAATGEFYRLYGLPDPDMIVDLVDRLAAAREGRS